jgi:predicted DNA-binding transcriptional regulator AlpA
MGNAVAKPGWIRISEAAKLASVSRQSVYKRIEKGQLPAKTEYADNRKIMFVRANELLAWANFRREKK